MTQEQGGTICASPFCGYDTRVLQLGRIAIEHSGRVFCCDACSEEWLDKAQDEIEVRAMNQKQGGVY